MSEVTLEQLKEKVLDFGLQKKLVKPLDEVDSLIKSEFLLLLGMHGLVPKRKSISVNNVIFEHPDLFLDWYLFEREERGKKTIAELYVESKDFERDFPHVEKEKAHTDIKNMKNPVWGYFVVCEKGEKNEYDVKLLEEESVYRVHDESTFSHVAEGTFIFTKLYPLGGKYYISESVLVFPEKLVEEYEQAKAFKNWLDELFEEFIKGKKVKEKTKRKYEDMYFLLSHYVSKKGYKSMKRVKRLNVDTWVKWARREWGISRYKEDECRSAVKQFLKFLKDRE